jgi:hypothetical protein
MSMKSTTPRGERDAVDQVADRAAAHERDRERIARSAAAWSGTAATAPRGCHVSAMKIQRDSAPR